MDATHDQSVLVAEPAASHARHLQRLLRRMHYHVRLAADSRAAIDVLQRESPAHAIVAVELAAKGESLLARLARLPAIEHLIATGPGGDPGRELAARRSSATAYLARPVSAGPLAAALKIPQGRYEPVNRTRKGIMRCPTEPCNE